MFTLPIRDRDRIRTVFYIEFFNFACIYEYHTTFIVPLKTNAYFH